MKVPLLDLKPQADDVGTDLIEAVKAVINSNLFILGQTVEDFERNLADYLNVQYAVGVSSGTDALLVSLMALGVGQGDIVLTTPYSFFATAGVISRLGATPVFVDIDPQSFNISPSSLESWFNDNPADAARVKVIIPVHLFGQCAEMDQILEIACERRIYVVEDAAQAIGSKYPSKYGKEAHSKGEPGDRCAGSMGLMGCFSFFPSKNLGALGDAGAVTTNDPTFYEKLKVLRMHGAVKNYEHQEVGGNFRIDAIQAAALSAKLPHLDKWHQARRTNAARYDELFSDSTIVPPPLSYSRSHHIYNQYIIRVPNQRDELRAFLSEKGVASSVYYPIPFHLQPCFSYLGYQRGDFPKSEEAAEMSLALPIYPGLTPEMQQYVVSSISQFYKG